MFTSKNIQKFLIYFFVVLFVVILVVGVNRAQQTSIANQVAPVGGGPTVGTTGGTSSGGATAGQTQTSPSQPSPTKTASGSSGSATTKPSSGSTSSGSSSSGNTTTQTTPPPATKPKTATYTGSTYRTPWGNVTVQITVSGGKLTDVTTPNYPYSPPSQYAHQYLISQALAAGSANIQGVSGATYTTVAFTRSLESALSQAGI